MRSVRIDPGCEMFGQGTATAGGGVDADVIGANLGGEFGSGGCQKEFVIDREGIRWPHESQLRQNQRVWHFLHLFYKLQRSREFHPTQGPGESHKLSLGELN